MGCPVRLQFAVLLILSHALEPSTSNFLVDNLHVVTDFLPVNEKNLTPKLQRFATDPYLRCLLSYGKSRKQRSSAFTDDNNLTNKLHRGYSHLAPISKNENRDVLDGFLYTSSQ
jgi:hypothetical protein